ncbi:unnamed protein product [Schistosoma curassoni]|uniref:Ion_trans domain-containing protein n=1 Tax=Schistosoma curassoni TaxID=6186 RepID=A0A183KNB2_9TREM|nr:unnamed protein product [Schistosoma curassoni]
MFLHVFATVGKCLVVFSVVFIAFALSFHVLFRAPSYSDTITSSSSSSSLNQSIIDYCFPIIHDNDFNNNNNNNKTNLSISLELKPFQYLSLSLFKTLMMMLGEYEHTATIIEPYIGNHSFQLHYPLITFFFYTTFIFLVPIILMNLLMSLNCKSAALALPIRAFTSASDPPYSSMMLPKYVKVLTSSKSSPSIVTGLIGLAVGDIENVRRSAVQHLISQQVYWLADLEPKLTGIFRSKLYKSNWMKKTKLNKTTVSKKKEVVFSF